MSRNLIAAFLVSQSFACTAPAFGSEVSPTLRPTDEKNSLQIKKMVDTLTSAILSQDVWIVRNAPLEKLDIPVTILAMREIPISPKEPLGMSGIPKRYGEYLGYNQYEAILSESNNIAPRIDDKGKLIFDPPFQDLKEVKFPRIYHGLEREFPKNLSQLALANEKITKTIGGDQDLVIVQKTTAGKVALAYYQDGVLYLATHVSTGKSGHRTPSWTYVLGYRESFKRSSIYQSAPMPYAIHVINDIFMHHGHVDGSPLSHGCIRVPGFYQEILFKTMKNNTKIFIEL